MHIVSVVCGENALTTSPNAMHYRRSPSRRVIFHGTSPNSTKESGRGHRRHSSHQQTPLTLYTLFVWRGIFLLGKPFLRRTIGVRAHSCTRVRTQRAQRHHRGIDKTEKPKNLTHANHYIMSNGKNGNIQSVANENSQLFYSYAQRQATVRGRVVRERLLLTHSGIPWRSGSFVFIK